MLKVQRNPSRKLCYRIHILLLVLFMIFCCFILCSCQKERIIIKVDMSSDSKDMDDLEVVNDDYQTVLNRCEERLETISEESSEAALIYKKMGGIYAEYLEDGETAKAYIDKAIEIDKRENDEVELAYDYTEMSKIHISAGGDPQEGLQYLDKAEEICKRHGLTSGFLMASILANRGQIYTNMEEYKKAIDCFEKSQNIYINNQEEDIVLYIRIGEVYLNLGKYDSAEEQYQKAQKLCEDRGDEYYLATTLHHMGWLYGEKKDCETAIFYYEQALQYFKKIGDLMEEARICNNIAYYGYQIGWNPEQILPIAIEASRAIEKIVEETAETEQLKNIYKENLKVHYNAWTHNKSDEQFDIWYQETILEGKDWDDTQEEE